MSLPFNLTRMIPMVKIKPSCVKLRPDAPANEMMLSRRVRSTQTRVPPDCDQTRRSPQSTAPQVNSREVPEPPKHDQTCQVHHDRMHPSVHSLFSSLHATMSSDVNLTGCTSVALGYCLPQRPVNLFINDRTHHLSVRSSRRLCPVTIFQ
jgi:hypothetical protein